MKQALLFAIVIIAVLASCSKSNTTGHCTCAVVGGGVTTSYSPPLNHDSLETWCNWASNGGCTWFNN